MPNKPTTIQNSTNEKKFGFSTSANELSSTTRQFFIAALNIAIDTALAIRRTIASITDDNLNNEYEKTSYENLPKESESTYTAPTQNAMLEGLIFNGTVIEDCKTAKTAKTELSTYFKQLENMTDREYTEIGCTKIADGVYLLGNQIIQDSMLNETKDDRSTLNMYQAALALLRHHNSLSSRHISGTNRNKFFCERRESKEDSCTQIQIKIIQDQMLIETKGDKSTLNMYQAALARLSPLFNSLSSWHTSGTNKRERSPASQLAPSRDEFSP